MKRIFVYNLIALITFLASQASFAETYPQLDISGFKKYEYRNISINKPQNYFLALTQLGGYYGYTGGPWQEKLKLRILGRLSERLSVSYDIEQQPEFPDKSNVKVTYDKTELAFGDFYANFTGNEFASSRKFLNGVMLSSTDSWYSFLLVPSAKIKSSTHSLTTQKGNNTKGPYSLGHGSIVEGSEIITVNGVKQKRDVDYVINYFEGKVTFTRILTPDDEFKYTYEYTNILDLFFPTLSKRNFFGFRGDLNIDPSKFGQPAPIPEPVIDTGSETFPTIFMELKVSPEAFVTPEAIPPGEEEEEESLGIYRLENYPVVRFSEVLIYKGSTLKKDVDYFINYEEGKIRLTTPTLPSEADKLHVSYNYYRVLEEFEVIQGSGSRGPYNLSHTNIVAESEHIVVDETPYVRDLDYTINYKKGKITFGFKIGPTQNITIRYKHVAMALPPAPPPPKIAQALSLGSTYLRESAQKGAGTPTATIIETISNTTTYNIDNIIDANYTLYLAHFPIMPTDEASFTLRVNGVDLVYGTDYIIPTTEADAQGNAVVYPPDVRIGFRIDPTQASVAYLTDKGDLSDGLDTGTIKIFNPMPTIGRALLVTDEVTAIYTYKKNVFGRFGGQGTGAQEPYYLRNYRDIIHGSEIVRVWVQGSSDIRTLTRNSSIEVYDGDYSINYSVEPYITFNVPIEINENFSVTFYYVPPSAPKGQDINRDIFAIDGSYKFGERVKLEGVLARSSADQVYVTAPGSFEGFGDGGRTYTLNSTGDIIEASEEVYINGILRNKDIDYYISYDKPGVITFYYITPTTQDAISVYYEYQTISGVPGEVVPKAGTAYKIGISSKLWETFNVSGDVKEIEHSFTPLGGTSIRVGAKQKNFAAGINPVGPFSFSAKYTYKETGDPIAGYEEEKLYVNKYDQTISTGFNPYDLAKIDFSYRRYETLDDELPTLGTQEVNRHNNDTLLETYSGTLSPKQIVYGFLTYNNTNNFKYTEYQTQTKDRTHPEVFPETTKTTYFRTTNNFGLTERVKFGVDFQLSEPITRGPSEEAGVTKEAKTAHTLSRDTTYNLNLDLTFKPIYRFTTMVRLMKHKFDVLKGGATPLETNNETYRVNFSPWTNLRTSFDKNRQETQRVTVAGENPLSERNAANVTYTPFSNLSMSSMWTWDKSIEESGAKSRGNSNTYSLKYTPFTHPNFRVTTSLKKYDRSSESSTGSDTQTDSLSNNYNLTYIPHNLITFTSFLSYENYFNKLGDSLSNTINLEGKIGTKYNPTKELSLSTNYNHKSTINKRTTDKAPKDVLDAKASYKVFTWGTLTYDFSQELNKGEIQGGVLTDLNLTKITHALSIDFNIPQDNIILSNIVLKLLWKQLNYINHNGPMDNFVAQLWTFEGTLNF